MVFAPASPGSGRSPSWSFTGDVGATLECRLDRGATTISNWATCGAALGYDLTGQLDGTYTLSLRARDAAGNTSTVTTSSYVLGTTAPAAPSIGMTPTSPGNPLPRRGFSGEAGAVRVPARARRHHAVGLGHMHDPAHVRPDRRGRRHLHLLGPRSRRRGQHGRLDAVELRARHHGSVDAVDHLGTPDAGFGRFAVVVVHGDAGTSFQCKLERGATLISDWSSCSGSRSYPLAGEPDGTYVLRPLARHGGQQQPRRDV